jgi:6-phosphogluconate dehydrogenase (decarboxylating)
MHQLGMIGLESMGANWVRLLITAGDQRVVYYVQPEASESVK